MIDFTPAGLLASSTFCLIPWVEFHIFMNDEIRPCDQSLEAFSENGGQCRAKGRDLAAFWNSEHFLRLRKGLLRDEKLPEICAVCARNEAMGVLSRRQRFNNGMLHPTHPHAAHFAGLVERSAAHGCVALPPVTLAVKFANTCNLRCRPCNPWYSVSIDADAVQSEWNRNFDCPTPFARRGHVRLLQEGEEEPFADSIVRLMPDGGWLDLNGGEPVLSPAVPRVLRRLHEKGLSARTSLCFTTNLTNWNADLAAAIPLFRECRIHISLDSLAPSLRYQRHPSRLETMLKNLKRWRALGAGLTCQPVLNAYTALDLADVFVFCLAHGITLSNCELIRNHALSASVLPARAKLLARERITAVVALAERAAPELLDWGFAERLRHFCDQVLDPLSPPDEALRRTFTEFTVALDDSRGESLALACPELFTLWEEEFGPWPGDTTGRDVFASAARDNAALRRQVLRALVLRLEQRAAIRETASTKAKLQEKNHE